ncbi:MULTISPECIES: hypothetical protein [Serratia]|jgi:hypothetical protein|uniref:hypothetical protein n=1 Tax=Serratia TaxID=613 RepID=UPI00062A1983|nr:hypothetical protein [Serratia fonticola]AYM90984.1 hypothetical protein D9980_10520 [Serratia sp. 3ACOL1]AKG72045.1 hypothetical protein WN53_24595 [Serratia fonticola]ALX95726.1 hypothetical protein AV650_20220 [Serratia fonticola]MBL5903895.1 hypothetical protein [Serratia fonticola]MBP1016712.1 hypothetical protein [Serratia fonticola]
MDKLATFPVCDGGHAPEGINEAKCVKITVRKAITALVTGILWVDAAGHFNANLLTPFHFAAQQLPASVFLRMMRKISHFVTGL